MFREYYHGLLERSALFGVTGQAQKMASQMFTGIDMTVTALQPRY